MTPRHGRHASAQVERHPGLTAVEPGRLLKDMQPKEPGSRDSQIEGEAGHGEPVEPAAAVTAVPASPGR